MSNKYPNLPGVNINVKDGQLAITNSRTANSILIIAEAKTSKTVPEGPVYVSNQEELYENFGGYFYQGQLNPIAAQWVVAYKAGVNNVYLMALGQEDKKTQFVDLYNKLFEYVVDLQVSHVVLDGLYADEEITDLTPADFGVESIEDVSLPRLFSYDADTAPTSLVAPATLTVRNVNTSEEIVLTLDTGEVDVKDLNKQIQEAVQTYSSNMSGRVTLKGSNVSLLFDVPVELTGEEALTALGLTDVVEAQKIVGSPASLLAQYAEQISEEIGGTIAYIATSAPASYDLAGIKQHTDKLAGLNTQISPYLQIIAGPEVGVTVPGSLRTQWVSGVTHYAVLVNSLLPQFAATNRALTGVNQLRFNFSPRQLNTLVGNKFVTFHTKNGSVRVVDAVTTAPDLAVGVDIIKSDFTRLSTLRIMNYVISTIREICETFIGSPNQLENYNAMNTAIRASLDDTAERGIIQDARYSINLGESLDTAEIELTILPQFELRTVNTTIELSRPELFGTQE